MNAGDSVVINPEGLARAIDGGQMISDTLGLDQSQVRAVPGRWDLLSSAINNASGAPVVLFGWNSSRLRHIAETLGPDHGWDPLDDGVLAPVVLGVGWAAGPDISDVVISIPAGGQAAIDLVQASFLGAAFAGVDEDTLAIMAEDMAARISDTQDGRDLRGMTSLFPGTLTSDGTMFELQTDRRIEIVSRIGWNEFASDDGCGCDDRMGSLLTCDPDLRLRPLGGTLPIENDRLILGDDDGCGCESYRLQPFENFVDGRLRVDIATGAASSATVGHLKELAAAHIDGRSVWVYSCDLD